MMGCICFRDILVLELLILCFVVVLRAGCDLVFVYVVPCGFVGFDWEWIA